MPSSRTVRRTKTLSQNKQARWHSGSEGRGIRMQTVLGYTVTMKSAGADEKRNRHHLPNSPKWLALDASCAVTRSTCTGDLRAVLSHGRQLKEEQEALHQCFIGRECTILQRT